MSTSTQHGYLLLADISGYTSYLAGTELDHAQGILSELLETIVGRLKGGMTLSKLEGDCVFCYGLESDFRRGETVLEMIEATYLAFRDKVDSIRHSTTCTCNACRAIGTLDLKFITHHGDFAVQTVAGARELVGSDVNLAHRLLKNHVVEQTGWRAYALFTAPSLAHIGLSPDGLRQIAEEYEYLGTVDTFSLDLRALCDELRARRRVVVTAADALYTYMAEFDAPPSRVWEWLNDPALRNLWAPGLTWGAQHRPGGRTAPGAVNHCAHGKGTSVETLLDVRPFDYITSEMTDGGTAMRRTITFEALDDGRRTRTRHYIDLVKLPRPRPRPIMKKRFPAMLDGLYKYKPSYDCAPRRLSERMATEGSADAGPEAKRV
ncbi:MAG: DUF2652 domain-containing protein [Chloroflexi bacterium]|nr:DUF2652 domain-containing protein [Chloroflexota bacterium]